MYITGTEVLYWVFCFFRKDLPSTRPNLSSTSFFAARILSSELSSNSSASRETFTSAVVIELVFFVE